MMRWVRMMSALTKASTSLVASASACLNMSDTSGVQAADHLGSAVFIAE